MTVYWQDSMDLYNNNTDLGMNYITTNGTISTTGGRFGGGGWASNGGQRGLVRSLLASETDIWISFAMNLTGGSNADVGLCAVGSGSGTEMTFTYNAVTGVMKAWRGNLSTLLGSMVSSLSSGWHWFDAHFTYSASVGVMELWIDDTQVINLTGQNTEQNSGLNLIYGLVGGDGGSSVQGTFDDILFTDSRLGDQRIETLLPSSDAGPNQGTPSTGSNHYAVVDEAQWNTSNYITMPNTSGDKEVFGFSSLASTPATVTNVKMMLVTEKSDAGSYQLEPLVIASATEADGSAQQLLTSWGVQWSHFPVNPSTSAAWAYTAVNAMTGGFKVP